ncbi:hypothetical protein ABZ348_12385 [Streptomyces sp. NPDC005963]
MFGRGREVISAEERCSRSRLLLLWRHVCVLVVLILIVSGGLW